MVQMKLFKGLNNDHFHKEVNDFLKHLKKRPQIEMVEQSGSIVIGVFYEVGEGR